MQVYPSVLEPTIERLIAYFPQIYPHFSHFQIDIADGTYVPDKTSTLKDIIKAVSEGSISLKDKTTEFHLMEAHPEEDISLLNQYSQQLNITSIIIHLRPFLNNSEVIIRSSQIPLGLSLDPNESIRQYWETIKAFPIVQLMTVIPGKQGTPFIPEVLDKITELREHGYQGKIILDGAMNDTTLPIILKGKHLPDAVCPGSYFKNDSKQQLEKLNAILEAAL